MKYRKKPLRLRGDKGRTEKEKLEARFKAFDRLSLMWEARTRQELRDCLRIREAMSEIKKEVMKHAGEKEFG